MSFAHQFPSSSELRDEALKQAEDFFEENEMDFNQSKIVSIVTPSRFLFDNFPLQPFLCRHCKWVSSELIERAYPVMEQLKTILFACFFFSLYYLIVLICLPFNLVTFIDCLCWDAYRPDREDLLQTTFIIFSDSVFVYKRKIPKMKYRWFTGCLNLGLYSSYPLEIAYFSYNGISVSKMHSNTFKSNDYYTSFRISTSQFVHRTSTYDLLIQAKQNYHGCLEDSV
eukprot:snap_masked-scaffold_42-processed-gene-1.33-mRNA-1 protein AED:1.00 eAED:1.00 QI:0/-1/0/0/-1/1/1/0/225